MRNPFCSPLAIVLSFGTALIIAAASATKAGNHGCAHCGREQSCQKVCRLVCEEKKVNVVCWGGKCEDFCLPGHSQRDGKHCEAACEAEACNQDGICSKPKPFVWHDWIPGCSKGSATKHKLMKKTVVKTVPSYKWVVEDLCPQCLNKCQNCEPPPSGAPVPPPPPAPGAKVVYGRVE
jgi:hypothetical protein